uniref:Conotoxin Lt5.8 n=1 Tax=Conus litteratus TaxID=89445 RepID=CT58_CONLT|nr:RecName: Full=Conotoxin Lt5.8; AltName: Full=Lt5h; Flags: Precursor [Conus litteratus]ABC70195.1 T-superfamily conotoxin lt5h precursor [Conus litteratus]
MLCLPVFIILLLLVSPAATMPVDLEILKAPTKESRKDFEMRIELLRSKRQCCRPANMSCCQG